MGPNAPLNAPETPAEKKAAGYPLKDRPAGWTPPREEDEDPELR